MLAARLLHAVLGRLLALGLIAATTGSSAGMATLAGEGRVAGNHVRVVDRELGERDGRFQGLTPSSLLLVLANGTVAPMALDEVFLVRFPGGRPSREGGVRVQMLSGDRLRGTITGGDDESLVLRGDLGEALRVSLDFVASLHFGADPPGSAESTGRAGAGPGVAAGVETGGEDSSADRLLVRAREGVDRIDGILESLGEGELRFRSDAGLLTFADRDVLSLTLGGQPVWSEPSGIRLQVETLGGSRITGAPLEGAPGEIRLRTPYGFDVGLEAGRCRVLEILGGRVVSLSRLDPGTVEQIPALGGPERFLFPWTRDRALAGGPLLVSGERFERGIACHSRTRLVYGIEGLGARVFRARIGISDEVRELAVPGSVVFRVRVDGQPRFTSRVMTLGRGPDPVEVEDLEGARTLELEVDFADDLDAGDRAVWGEAILETASRAGS